MAETGIPGPGRHQHPEPHPRIVIRSEFFESSSVNVFRLVIFNAIRMAFLNVIRGIFEHKFSKHMANKSVNKVASRILSPYHDQLQNDRYHSGVPIAYVLIITFYRKVSYRRIGEYIKIG